MISGSAVLSHSPCFPVCFLRELRVQKELEAAELKKAEAAVLKAQALQDFIDEKEREILQLQVCFSIGMSYFGQ